jgi:hypothetical protein
MVIDDYGKMQDAGYPNIKNETQVQEAYVGVSCVYVNCVRKSTYDPNMTTYMYSM